MYKIAIDNTIPYIEGLLDEVALVKYLDHDNFVRSEIVDCDAIIVRSTIRCNSELLNRTNVKYIATATAGFDHIDLDYCAKNNIQWCNAPGCNSESVAQYVLATLSYLMLQQNRRLRDIRLGIVGVGHAGGTLMKIAKQLGIYTMGCDPPREEMEGVKMCTMQELAEECDVITFHTPLTKDGKYPTYHLLDANFLQLCKRQPIIVNACRGAVACTEDLITAKNKSTISHLIIDCWEGEPNISQQLLSIVDIGTTHIAGFSADSKLNATVMSVNSICRLLSLPPINPTKLTTLRPIKEDINLCLIPENKQIEMAILSTTDYISMDKLLKNDFQKFNELRRAYLRPRAFKAYKVKTNSEDNKMILKKIGFITN